jgi:hypothetical protein
MRQRFSARPAPRRDGRTHWVNVPITARPGAQESPAREARYAQPSRNCTESPAIRGALATVAWCFAGIRQIRVCGKRTVTRVRCGRCRANRGTPPRQDRRRDGAPQTIVDGGEQRDHPLDADVHAVAAADGHLVPIANISRREHDETYPDSKQFRVLRLAGPGDGRQLWKRWCVHPTVSCPRCRQTIMN